ncbi:tetratricopeptide repeat protein [Fusobacterium polymorphum]|uniref:tetratricopeptide repeat protein n=1 Tax=Fusobacterium nucleatum subsp. polymorphum TaxID=76857 RepID=UPI003008CCD2
MLKKLSVLIVAGILVGCTNIDNLGGKKDSGPIREIGGEPQIPGETKIVEDVPTDDGKVVNKEANNENIKEYLSIVKGNLKGSVKKVEDSVENNYTVGLGETLVFPLDNERAIKLTASPKNTNTKINLSNGKVSFRSVYQGQYVLSTYVDGSLNRKIAIAVIAKYDFSEREVYDVIMQNFESKSKDLENAVTLYKMMFPTGRYAKEVNYLFLKYAYDIKNTSLMSEALAGVKNDFSSYSDSEKATILRVAKLTNKDIFVPSETYKTSDTELKSALQEYVGNKGSLDKNDKVFIEKTKKETPETANTVAREKVRAVLDETVLTKVGSTSGTSPKTVKNTTSKTETNGESYYDKAMKNLNSNPRVAIENFKKSLSTEKIQDKKPEIYYNIASSYAKLGNKVEVTKYLRLLKQEFPNSEWVKRSEALTK